jgi:hypothetical protein
MRPLIAAAIFTTLALVGGVAPVRAQSLAEVAQKEQERRKSVKPATKVLTNKDLGDVPAPAAVPPADTKAPDAAKTVTPAEPVTDVSKTPVKDQAYWSGRMKELRTQIERDGTYVEALQTRVNSLSADFVNRDDPAQRAVIERDRQRAIAELNRLKKAVEDGKKAIAALEEEARRAGTPPGWLR